MIGLATIGQSPRDDVAPEMFSSPARGSLIQAGALDGLVGEDIALLAPGPDEHPLVTRLADGQEVVIAKERIVPLMQEAIDRLESNRASLICVLCTGEFDLRSCRSRLVYPDRVLAGIVDALLPAGRLGVLVPHAGQAARAGVKWGGQGRAVIVSTYSPYDTAAGPEDALAHLATNGVDAVMLDCMGFSGDIAAVAKVVTGVPVLQANRMVGTLIETMI